MNEQHFRELSAARALHALSAEEEQAFSRALAEHPDWQAVVDEDRETAAALGAATPEVAPPAFARATILDLISKTQQFDPIDPSADPADPTSGSDPDPALASAPPPARGARSNAPAGSGRGRRRAAGWFALAASVAVLLTGALVFPWGDIVGPKDPVSVALQQVEAARDAQVASAELPDGATAALHWSTHAQQAVFVTEGMRGAPAKHDYELWIVRGDRPISVGVMRIDRDGSAAMLAPGFEPGDALAVTVEEEGGSPTGAPTTDPIMVVATA